MKLEMGEAVKFDLISAVGSIYTQGSPYYVHLNLTPRSSESGHANLNLILGSQRLVAIALTLSLLTHHALRHYP